VAAAKRKKAKKGSDWSWRLAGLALCAFFALGVITGLSRSGRSLAVRIEALLRMLPRASHSALIPPAAAMTAPPSSNPNSIALVDRPDGYYVLNGDGGLCGPVTPAATADLPILSGASVRTANGDALLAFASDLVRAEAVLGLRISELEVESDDQGVFDLERPAVALTIDFSRQGAELERGARILGLWREHSEMLAAVDLTIPGQAIVQVRPELARASSASAKPGRVSVMLRTSHARNKTLPEVSARR
jgi:hypothetical protein